MIKKNQENSYTIEDFSNNPENKKKLEELNNSNDERIAQKSKTILTVLGLIEELTNTIKGESASYSKTKGNIVS